MGGEYDDIAAAIAVDSGGNVYATGHFYGDADFDQSADSLMLRSNGGDGIFVCKLNADGHILWANGYGGSSDDVGLGIAVDRAANVYVTGRFTDTTTFDPHSSLDSVTSLGGGA